jgi:hypothetical protein
MNYTKEQVAEIMSEAQFAARLAAENYFQVELGGVDRYACGFAWVEVFGIKGSTKLGKILKSLNFSQAMWNPAKFPAQNVDTLYAGAVAAANVLKAHGFNAHACSRLD